ncbi:hypothetical protein [Pseudoxanthomonas mexicana]
METLGKVAAALGLAAILGGGSVVALGLLAIYLEEQPIAPSAPGKTHRRINDPFKPTATPESSYGQPWTAYAQPHQTDPVYAAQRPKTIRFDPPRRDAELERWTTERPPPSRRELPSRSFEPSPTPVFEVRKVEPVTYVDARGREVFGAMPAGPNAYWDEAGNYRQTFDRGDGVQQTFRNSRTPREAFDQVGQALSD